MNYNCKTKESGVHGQAQIVRLMIWVERKINEQGIYGKFICRRIDLDRDPVDPGN